MTGDTKPTAKQLAFLKQLAVERGCSFTYPHTRAQAHFEIERLLRRSRSQRFEIRADRDATTRDKFDTGVPAIRADEITGYGATTTWKGR